jgi:large subunit ribosomal protein L21e
MGHSRGLRSGTRFMFSRKFGQQGRFPLSIYLGVNKTEILAGQKDPKLTIKPLRMGDYVDIYANAAIHKGMPHKWYHGRTGIVYNVAKRAVGVEVNKVIRGRIEKKRVNIRIEHVHRSTCREDFLSRVKRNDEVKRVAKSKGQRVPIEQIKRFPQGPKAGFVVQAKSAHGLPVTLTPQPFDDML